MKTNFNLSINEELLDVAKQYCESLDQNLNDLIARLLREFLKSEGHYVGPKPGDITPRTAQPTEEDIRFAREAFKSKPKKEGEKKWKDETKPKGKPDQAAG